MIRSIHKKQSSLPYKIFCGFVALTFLTSVILPPGIASAQTILNLPVPGTMVAPSAGFMPARLIGVTIHPDNPLKFDFIINTGDAGLAPEALKEESRKLIKYFLASLTVPEEELWVNLSPYEKDRMVPQGLGQTEMGRDMLAQDYLLKQLTASLMYPEKELGKKFWEKIYKEAREKYGTAEIPVNTFNKVWVVPQEAVVYEKDTSAFVVRSHLRVMLEQDYVAAQHNPAETPASLFSPEGRKQQGLEVSSQIIREIILPEIEREVNEGENFANLRQMYNSLILAAWYKLKLKNGLLGKVYVDRNKTKGIDAQDEAVNQKIYDQYIESFRKGVYNYIKEDTDPATQDVIPRKYFSGGLGFGKGILKMVAAALVAGTLAQPAQGEELIKKVSEKGRTLRVATMLGENFKGQGTDIAALEPPFTIAPEPLLLAQNETSSSPPASVNNAPEPASPRSPLGEAEGQRRGSSPVESVKIYETTDGQVIQMRGGVQIIGFNRDPGNPNRFYIPEESGMSFEVLRETMEEGTISVRFDNGRTLSNVMRVTRLSEETHVSDSEAPYTLENAAPRGKPPLPFYDIPRNTLQVLYKDDKGTLHLLLIYPAHARLWFGPLGRLVDLTNETHDFERVIDREEVVRMLEHAHNQNPGIVGRQRNQFIDDDADRKTFPALDIGEGNGANIALHYFAPDVRGELVFYGAENQGGVEAGVKVVIKRDGKISKTFPLGITEEQIDRIVSVARTHLSLDSAQEQELKSLLKSDRLPEWPKEEAVKSMSEESLLPVVTEKALRPFSQKKFDRLATAAILLAGKYNYASGEAMDSVYQAMHSFFYSAQTDEKHIADALDTLLLRSNPVKEWNMDGIAIMREVRETVAKQAIGITNARGWFEESRYRFRLGISLAEAERKPGGYSVYSKIILEAIIDSERFVLSREELLRAIEDDSRIAEELKEKIETEYPGVYEIQIVQGWQGTIHSMRMDIRLKDNPDSSPLASVNNAPGATSLSAARQAESSSPVAESRPSSDISRQLKTDDGRLTTNPGGIDLNPALLDLQIRRDGDGVQLPLPQQPIETMHIDGFVPIIINITPIPNLPLLLGLADTQPDTRETRPDLKAREPGEVSYLN